MSESARKTSSDQILATVGALCDKDIVDAATRINLENIVLTVSDKKCKSREEGETGGKFHQVERSFGSFRRTLTVPRTVHAEGITAEFDNGLPGVRLPKVTRPSAGRSRSAARADAGCDVRSR